LTKKLKKETQWLGYLWNLEFAFISVYLATYNLLHPPLVVVHAVILQLVVLATLALSTFYMDGLALKILDYFFMPIVTKYAFRRHSASVLKDILYRFQNWYWCRRRRKSWTFYVDSIIDIVCAYITSVDIDKLLT